MPTDDFIALLVLSCQFKFFLLKILLALSLQKNSKFLSNCLSRDGSVKAFEATLTKSGVEYVLKLHKVFLDALGVSLVLNQTSYFLQRCLEWMSSC
jgi:hypothetical protein